MTEEENPNFGFKCLHYSVTESAGHVEITVKRKNPTASDVIGVRTQDGTAKAPKDYGAIDQKLVFKTGVDTATVQIPIVDDEAWNPDLEFEIILYDLTNLDSSKGSDRLPGGDTLCKVTILDEDFPGTIEFVKTDVSVAKKAKYIDVEIQRIDGSDGTIHCQIETEVMPGENTNAAQPFEDFIPIQTFITFPHGETFKTVRIELAKPDPMAEEEKKETKKGADESEGEDDKGSEDEGSESDEQDLQFKIKLSDPKPEGAKISSNKRLCIITVASAEDFEAEQDL